MKRFIFLLILLAITYYLLPSPANAQEKSALSLGIFPPVIEINADPPAKILAKIKIQNQNDNPQKLDIVLRPFKPSEKNNGQIEYVNDTGGPDPLILQKIKVMDGDREIRQVELAPLETKELNLLIIIEQGAPLGDYYFSVIFVAQNQTLKNQSASAIPGGIGTNVIMSVGKKGKINGHIIQYSTPFWQTHGPVPITLLVENDSPQYIVPTGRITIKDIFGKVIGVENILPQYILSGSKRYMNDNSPDTLSGKNAAQKMAAGHDVLLWPESFLFGIYTLNLNMKLSSTGPVFTTSIIFVALPLYFIFALSFFAFILLGIYVRVRRKV